MKPISEPVLAVLSDMTFEGTLARLHLTIAAERGRSGLPGWTWAGDRWRKGPAHDCWSCVPMLGTVPTWVVWYARYGRCLAGSRYGMEGPPMTALEAMEWADGQAAPAADTPNEAPCPTPGWSVTGEPWGCLRWTVRQVLDGGIGDEQAYSRLSAALLGVDGLAVPK